jgi:hypothetical protein
MAKSITYIGLDVHKDTIAVALAETGLRGEVRGYGKIPNTPTALKALSAKLARTGRHRAGKLPTVITAGIARELAGFIWAIARQAQPTVP